MSSTSLAKTEVVNIAGEDDWAPFSSIKQDRSGLEGFAVDIVREAFKTQGIEVRFQALPFARCMHYAKTGRVSGCFNAARVESNTNDYCWHPTPMFEESLLIFGPAGSPRSDMKISDLEGLRVGSTIAYNYPDAFTQNPRIRHFGTVSDDQLIRMLIAGRVDFILLNATPAYRRIQAEPAFKGKLKAVGTISKDSLWVAFGRQEENLRYCEIFEKGLKELMRSGRYREIESIFRKSYAP